MICSETTVRHRLRAGPARARRLREQPDCRVYRCGVMTADKDAERRKENNTITTRAHIVLCKGRKTQP